MLTDQSARALTWIIQLLDQHQIRYQIAGGLAAQVYGAKRALFDIDIDIPNSAFSVLLPTLQPYLIYGPSRFYNEEWQLLLATLNYGGQLIDLGGADDAWLFDKLTQQWVQCEVNFDATQHHHIAGQRVAVIAKADLLKYKAMLRREVDLLDLMELSQKSTIDGDGGTSGKRR
jgi:hypothetical protein